MPIQLPWMTLPVAAAPESVDALVGAAGDDVAGARRADRVAGGEDLDAGAVVGEVGGRGRRSSPMMLLRSTLPVARAGSMVAFPKLQELIQGRPITYPGRSW